MAVFSSMFVNEVLSMEPETWLGFNRAFFGCSYRAVIACMGEMERLKMGGERRRTYPNH
jgi:hypothetical protein